MRSLLSSSMRIMSVTVMLVVVFASAFLNVFPAPGAYAATDFGDTHFQSTWAYTDQPVAAGSVNRTWMWGPQPDGAAIVEPYWDSSTGWRLVQYFDKTRMEITHPDGDQSSIWYVTNGLLAKELITGNMQIGDDKFVQYSPAQVNVAGDANDPNGPTYATFNTLMGNSAIPSGWLITQTVDRNGDVAADNSLSSYNVTAKDVGAPTNHNVASVFWDFMTSSGPVDQNGNPTTDKLFQNPFYATGYPLTEAYWTRVLVGGIQKQVLVQVFERRVLTYTPDNPDGWKVEAGNVGQHYYTWRYMQLQQSAMPMQDLNTAQPSVHSCTPFTYSESRFSADTFYGEHVTLSYQGTACDVFHPQDGVWWDQITGTAKIYHGTDTSVEPFDTRTFSDLSIFQDPSDYSGWPGPSFSGSTCTATSFYKRWTVDGALESIIRKVGDTWDSAGQIFTNPVTNFDFPGPCSPPQSTLAAGAGTPGSLGLYFDARLDPNTIQGDPQNQVAYMFNVFGTDLSQVDVKNAVHGPVGSTPVYHAGNAFFLYLDPSTPAGMTSVSLDLPDGSHTSTTFDYIPTIGGAPSEGGTLDQSDLTTWPTYDGTYSAASVADGAYHLLTKGYADYGSAWDTTQFGDASVSLDMKLDTTDSSGFACLSVHAADPFNSNQFDYCLLSSGETVVVRHVSGTDELILARAQRPGTNAVSDWNTLKIVSKGNVYWFFMNGTLIGSTQHSGGANPGTVGFWVHDSGDQPIEWAFKNLLVKAVQ